MCEEIEKTPYILKEGTILYSGNKGTHKPLTIQDIFKYVGQRNLENNIKGEFVLYASTNYNTAFAYAQSCALKHGYIHKFKVDRDIELYEQPVFEDYEVVAKCVCPEVRGIAVIYSKSENEFALCSSEEYLEYIESIDCRNFDYGWHDLFETLALRDLVDHINL